MKDQDYRLNDFSERTTQKTYSLESLKLKIFLFSAFILLIIIGLILLLIYFLTLDENKHIKENLVGEINCLYDIKDISKETTILGENFEKLSSLEIYINSTKINPSKKYKFEKEGLNEVKFEVYEDLKMDYMFQNILDLQNVKMNSTKNASLTSMKSTFENCQNLKLLNIIGFNTKKVESMSKLFYGTNLSFADINGLATNNVKDMSFMFASSKVKILDLSGLNTTQVTNMSYMFYGSYVETLKILNIETKKVQYMGYMFCNCSNLLALDLSKFSTLNVIDMNYMFANDENLMDLDLSSFNTSSCQLFENLFENCFNLTITLNSKKAAEIIKVIPSYVNVKYVDNDILIHNLLNKNIQ